jgi:hypothetical protein
MIPAFQAILKDMNHTNCDADHAACTTNPSIAEKPSLRYYWISDENRSAG